MGVAVCHSIPRDGVVLVSVGVIAISLILQAVVFGEHGSERGSGFFTSGKGNSVSDAVAFVGGHASIYDFTYSVRYQSRRGQVDSSTVGVLCDASGDTLSNPCFRFLESFHALNGLFVSSFVVCFLCIVFCVFFVVRVSRSTLQLLVRICIAMCLPMTLYCALVGVFFTRVVPNALDAVAVARGLEENVLVFHRHWGPNLLITSMVLSCVAFIACVVRCASVWYLRKRFLASKQHTREQVEGITRNYMINDDWVRQRQILLSHARSVEVEIAVNEQLKGAAGEGVKGHSNRGCCSIDHGEGDEQDEGLGANLVSSLPVSESGSPKAPTPNGECILFRASGAEVPSWAGERGWKRNEGCAQMDASDLKDNLGASERGLRNEYCDPSIHSSTCAVLQEERRVFEPVEGEKGSM